MTSSQVLRVIGSLVGWLAANNYKVCPRYLTSDARSPSQRRPPGPSIGLFGGQTPAAAISIACTETVRRLLLLSHRGLLTVPTHLRASDCCKCPRLSSVRNRLRSGRRVSLPATLLPVGVIFSPLHVSHAVLWGSVPEFG